MKMRAWNSAAAIVCISLALTACEQSPFAKISSLEQAVEAQSARIGELETKLKDAQLKLFVLELGQDSYESATFDPAADQGFGRIDTSVGTLAVSIQEVKPHADGVKVRLHVGNLTSATISGGIFKVKWGPRRAKIEGTNFAQHYAEWQKKLLEKESSFTEDLRPGSWNNLTLTLPGIPSEQFGHLELSLETNQIKLFAAK